MDRYYEYDPTDWRGEQERRYEKEQSKPRDAVVQTPNTNYQAASKAIGSMSTGSNGYSSAGNAMLAYGGATGNPYLLAGGAAMGVLGNKVKQDDEYEMRKYQAEQDRKQRLSNSLSEMARLYQGMRL